MTAASPLLHRAERARNVTAVLGPTNTGKTHLAIDRMLARRTGLIGLPLRLLAREVYGRIVARIGPDEVALVTGEEKIVPPRARFHVATVEAMPLDLEAEFVAIDEVQLAGDLERGRVFTDRMLRVRGLYETLLLGAPTARSLLEKLIPGIHVVTRPRMSILRYNGEKKLARLPPRSAIVAFSAAEVYAIAELIRRMRGGAAIVMGALSPRTRNAQVELFQSGDVDFLVATDAIGMGLNLDVDHVAFASNRKFDGYQFRPLSAAELGQIAGRAGRYTRDGTFGVTARVAPFEDELVEALETHAFAPLKVFQWRNPVLDFRSLAHLRASLDEPAREDGLTKAPPADDQKALEHAMKNREVVDLADDATAVERLWEVCQVPDYRKIAPATHADLIVTLFEFLVRGGKIPDDWFARQVQYADKTEGDIDTLSNRIAHVRTWTFVANRNDWLADPAEWRETTRAVEDRLSDALHERLMQRFVDRRTSVLMKRLRENAMLESEVNDAGDVMVEGQHVGTLHGFRFQADPSGGDPRDVKALRSAAGKALTKEIERRADRLAAASDAQFALASDGAIRWQGAVVGKIVASDDTLKPTAVLLADELLAGASRDKVQGRVTQWLAAHIGGLLKPLFDLREPPGVEGSARGLAYRISEGLGSVERSAVADEAKGLDQAARAGLRALGVRFGAYHIFVPALLKPAPSQLIALLWALKHADLEVPGLTEVPQLSASGRTSIAVDPAVPGPLYQAVGFRPCGPRAVRIDILERLADQIRPLVAWRPGPDAGEPPAGAVPQGGGFLVTVAMTSLLGCSGEDFAAVLTSLGYRVDRHEASAAEREAMRVASEVRSRARKDGPRPVAAAAPHAAGTVASAVAGEPDGATEADTDFAAEPADFTADVDAEAMADVPEAADGAATMVAPDAVSDAIPDGAEASEPAAAPIADGSAAEGVSAADGLEGAAVPAEAPFEATAEAPFDAPAEAQFGADDGAAPVGQPGDALDLAVAVDLAAADDAEAGAAATTGDPEPATEATVPGVGDAGAATVPVEAADVTEPDAAPSGPVLIEVWRVPRHQRSGEAPRRRRTGGERGDGGRDRGFGGRDRPAGERPAFGDGAGGERRGPDGRGGGERRSPGGERRDGGGDRRHGAGNGPGHAGRRDDRPAPAAAAAEGGPPRREGRRDERQPRFVPGADAGSARPAAPAARADGARPDDRRGDRRPDRRDERRGKPAPVASSAPPSRKEADPDSPFAALAALKARLEKGANDR